MHTDRRLPLCDSRADRPGGFSPAATVVLKVGGSLLDLPDLPQRLKEWLRYCGISRPLLIIGGGAAADAVRNWDRTYQLGDERAHQLAVQSMGLTRMLLENLLDGAVTVSDREAAQAAWAVGQIPLLDVAAFLRQEEPAANLRLPHSWAGTSDSIAAWVTRLWPAEYLVLGKSVPLPEELSEDSRRSVASRLAALADKQMTDPGLNQLAREIPETGWLFLRGDQLVYHPVQSGR